MQRWLTEPDFQENYRRAQEELPDSAINILRQASVNFANTIRDVADDALLSPALRLAQPDEDWKFSCRSMATRTLSGS